MILVGDNRATLPTIERGSVQCVATSPPYFGLRLYGDAGEEIGKERDLAAYVQSIVDVMALCRDALRDDGVAWVNLGDSYAQGEQRHRNGKSGNGTLHATESDPWSQGTAQNGRRLDHDVENGNALLVPFRVAMALQQDGWTLRAMLPWIKLASMPESVQSRPSMAHEYVLFLTKKPSGYFYDADAVRVAMSRGSAGSLFTTGKTGVNGAGRVSQLPREDNPAGRSYRSSDAWRAGAREAAAQLLAAADGAAIGLLTNDDAPAALVVNPKGSGIEHFAMWPTRLVAPMIMAGTPEAGSCSVCGAPWERVVERSKFDQASIKTKAARAECMRNDGGRNMGGQQFAKFKAANPDRPLGFRPSCAHVDAPARPAIVLDPFAGACTTLGVAEALGRQAIGCELYQANADLMPRRIDVVRTEMIEILKEQGSARAGDVEQAQKADRHKGAVRQDDGPLFGGKL